MTICLGGRASIAPARQHKLIATTMFTFWITHITRYTTYQPKYFNMSELSRSSIFRRIGWVFMAGIRVYQKCWTLFSIHIFKQITELPRQLFLCHGLKVLDISDNDLTSIPTALSSLVNIRKINLARNCKWFDTIFTLKHKFKIQMNSDFHTKLILITLI